MWFGDLDGGSVFLGDDRSLSSDRARGVQKLTPYTEIHLGILKDILNKEGIIGNLENRIIQSLKSLN